MKDKQTDCDGGPMKRMKRTVKRFIDETQRRIKAMPAQQRSGMTDLVAWLKAHPYNIYVGHRVTRRTSRRRSAAA